MQDFIRSERLEFETFVHKVSMLGFNFSEIIGYIVVRSEKRGRSLIWLKSALKVAGIEGEIIQGTLVIPGIEVVKWVLDRKRRKDARRKKSDQRMVIRNRELIPKAVRDKKAFKRKLSVLKRRFPGVPKDVIEEAMEELDLWLPG